MKRRPAQHLRRAAAWDILGQAIPAIGIQHAGPAAVCLALAAANPAAAQVLDGYFAPPTGAVGGAANDRSRQDAVGLYDSPGVHAGTFLIRPELTESAGFNSNVEGISGGRGSAIVRTAGSVNATSDWSRNSAFLSVTLDDQRVLDLKQQSFTNWTAGGGGTVDIGRDTLTVSYSHQNLNETPGSIDPVTVSQAVPFRVDTGQIGYTVAGTGRLVFTPAVQVTHYSYDDFSSGGQTVGQAYRDRLVTQGSLTTRYQLAPQRDLVLVVRGTHVSYETSTAGLPKRDSNGGAVLAGVDYPAPGSNVRFRVLAGLQLRQYDSHVYSSQTTPIVEASVVWTPTRLTTVTLTARRDIEDAADESIAGYTLTAARLSVEHELRRNIQLTGFGQILRAEFQSSKVAAPVTTIREAGSSQTIFGAGAGVSYLLNRNLRASLNYDLSDRTGSRAGANYVAHVIFAGLTFRL